MMTEEEAKTKWCPFARYSHSQEPSANRWKQSAPPEEPHALNPVSCRCIASQCAAWRWADPIVRHKTMGTFHHVSVLKHFNADSYERMPDRGYCGMASRPE